MSIRFILVKLLCRLVNSKIAKRIVNRFPHFRPLAKSGTTSGTEVSNFINAVLAKTSANAYLEIGVWTGRTIEAIRLNTRIAVDPSPRYLSNIGRGVRTFKCTSDEFFSGYSGGHFDLVFLDGLHHFDQTWRDICNAAAVMKPQGIILIDDVIPVDKYSALIPRDVAIKERHDDSDSESLAWHGDVFRVMFLLQHFPENFTFATIVFENNPRAFLLCDDGDWSSFPVLEDSLIRDMHKKEAESVFGFNPFPVIPDSFNPVTVETAHKIMTKHLASFNSF